MIDLFGLPKADFPGYAPCDHLEDPWRRVEAMEAAFAGDIQDARFIPYLQLHEFEALILADPAALMKYYPDHDVSIESLRRSLGDRSPEEINRMHPPSHRIKQAIPGYDKRTGGCVTVLEIGLPKILDRCRHFRGWVDKLRALDYAPAE